MNVDQYCYFVDSLDCGAAVVCVAKRFAGDSNAEVAANSEVARIGGANYYWCFDENYFELVDFEVLCWGILCGLCNICCCRFSAIICC